MSAIGVRGGEGRGALSHIRRTPATCQARRGEGGREGLLDTIRCQAGRERLAGYDFLIKFTWIRFTIQTPAWLVLLHVVVCCWAVQGD